MCNLSLPDSIIDGIVIQSNTYAKAGTILEATILVNGVMNRNPRWMHSYKYREISRQHILFFFACYYYMGYCRLPARRDYWVQRHPNSCLPAHWTDGQISCIKFEYVWRNISLDSLLTDEEIDNSVEVDNDSQFEPETEAEEFIVETVEEDEDNNNDDDDDDDESKKDEEQNDYFDDKELALEEEDDNDDEMDNNNNDDSVDDETINEDDDDDKVELEK